MKRITCNECTCTYESCSCYSEGSYCSYETEDLLMKSEKNSNMDDTIDFDKCNE